MDRIIKDGKVAVVYSPGFGSGWYTWARHDDPSMMFDPGLVGLILSGDKERIIVYTTLKWPNELKGGVDDLEVGWVSVGAKFRIHEYDGSESIEIQDEIDWIVA